MNQKKIDLIDKYISHIKNSLYEARFKKSKLNKEILKMDGLSGDMTRHFYNNIVNFDDARYLEIGTWKGSSVCSAMYKNNATIVCIDNWSEFNGPKDEFMNNFNKYKGNNKASFIEHDAFSLNISILPKFNMYMYDAGHEEEEQCMALTHYYDCMDDIFIYIVDDWNWAKVRNGTKKGIEKCNLKILYETEIRTTDNDEHSSFYIAKISWWNGMYVALLSKQ